MARVRRTENDLEKLYNKHKNYAKTLFIASGISFLASIFTVPLFLLTRGLSFGLTVMLGASAFVCFVIGGINFSKIGIYKSGLEGEARSEGALLNLPDDYYIFPSIDIVYEGKRVKSTT